MNACYFDGATREFVCPRCLTREPAVLTRGQPWVVGIVADALAARLAERFNMEMESD